MSDEHRRHEDQGEILMGCWDCGSCGAQRLRGDAYQCASCGAPRPADVRFYLPDNAEVIRDQEGIRAAEAGPDWQCAFCESWMSATESVCRNCQGPAAESERRQKTNIYEAELVPRSSQRLPPIRATATARNQQGFAAPLPYPRTAPRARLSVPVLLVIGLLAVAAVIYGMNLAARRRAYQQELVEHQALVFATQQKCDEARTKLAEATRRVELAEQAVVRAQREVTTARNAVTQLRQTQQAVEHATKVSVVSHAWSVQLQIEQCGAKQGEGWNHPPDAFDVRSEERVHHHVQVLDHVETLYRPETYREQDGFDTETYTERVSAGTREVPDGFDVEDLGNGRFRQTPKYRSETVYTDVTKTRQTPRMVTRTRQVPYQNNVYRQDPVRQPWYTYRTKVWMPAPALSRAGQGLQVLDPEGRPPQDPGNELGAQRVRARNVTCSLVLQPVADDSSPRTITVPNARWRSFADGSTGLLAQAELLTAAEQQARLAALRSRIDETMKQIVELEAKVPPLAEQIDSLREQVPPLSKTLATLQAELSRAKQGLAEVIAGGY